MTSLDSGTTFVFSIRIALLEEAQQQCVKDIQWYYITETIAQGHGCRAKPKGGICLHK